MPKEQFKREVEKELTGKESEPSELVYFKLVVELSNSYQMIFAPN
jgi:hypothetical protein